MTDEFPEVRQAIERAVAELHDLPDLDAFHAANSLTTELFAQIAIVGSVRAHAAKRIRDRDDLSLAQLAAALGISRSRADQLVRGAKQAKK